MKKWKKTEDLIIGDMVGENILSYPNMEIIASKGDIVSNLMLNRLKTFNISWIEIEDIFSLDDDVKISRIFSEDKIENMRKQVYRVWEEIISDRKINIRKVELLSETFVKEIENKYGDLLAPNLCKVIDFDEYTFSHQINVAVIASLISFEIFEERWEFIKEMATGALIHDIGKVMIPKEILNLKRKLTAEEHDIIKHHVDFGYEMAKFSSVSEDNILDCIKYHHENWNGKGYMYGLKEESIPLPGRILAVADVYDALTTRRPYKNAWTPYQAISYIIQKSGRIFDPNVVESFLRVFGIYPVGTSLRLSSGEKAVVVANNRNAIASPVVIISKDEGFKRINLATQKNLYIAEILENTYSNI